MLISLIRITVQGASLQSALRIKGKKKREKSEVVKVKEMKNKISTLNHL